MDKAEDGRHVLTCLINDRGVCALTVPLKAQPRAFKLTSDGRLNLYVENRAKPFGCRLQNRATRAVHAGMPLVICEIDPKTEQPVRFTPIDPASERPEL